MAIRGITKVFAAALLGTLAGAGTAAAQQTVFLATDTAHREVWRGETAGSQAGLSLDRGDVNAGDTRRDLIVGAPGWSSNQGRVYVLFSGPVRRGEVSFASADAILSGGAAGDRFGEATAAGYITARESDTGSIRDLVVGAPGTNSGSGRVYMYLRGLTAGQRLTPADARITITGAPAGARLGATLATGDVDGDGYREIIIGAPGVGNVYVVKGGPAVTGTIDLSVPSPAFFVIQGSPVWGVGRSLAAGDLTGDNIYDIAIGAFNEPGGGAVYVLRGRTSNSFPATMTLTTSADARFGGIDSGDWAGKTLDIAPFDTDNTSDLLIGAPMANGPANGRVGAGEVYVIWGSATLASRSLASADVTIYGPSEGSHEGSDVATGDVDRRAPYDLVSLAPGTSGAGEIHMILGRPRSGFTATYDLATTLMDRKLVGDPAAGPIESALVYDLTGEGVEDIVAGIPSGNQGLVYVSFSPVFEAILSYPLNGQTNATVNRPFEWNAIENADMYRLTIGTGTGRSDLYDSGEIAATSVMVPSLPYDRTLSARLYTRIASVWRSKDSTFRVPTPSSFIFPAAGMGGVRPGFFSWSSVAGADGYRMLVGSSAGAGDYTDTGDITTTSARVFSLPQGQTVYARIMTKLSGAYAWTDISFTTATTTATGADSAGRGIGANFGADAGGDAFLYKPGSGPWSMQLGINGSGFAAVNSGLWAAGWTVKAGELNGDGLTDLFLYNETNGQWFKAFNVGGGNFGFFGSRWAAGWNVTLVDFDGDGRSDVFLYNKTSGQWFKAMNTGDGDFTYVTGRWAPGWTIYPADFDGDGRADLFIYNTNAASDANSGRWFRVLTQPDGSFGYDGGTKWANDWQITPGDYNGDGRTDLFLYRPSGQWFRVVFVDNAPTFEGGAWAAGWTIRKGDFNADGLADLFLYSPSTGRWFVVITERSGSLTYYTSLWAKNWEVSISDFNSDGVSDVLLYNSTSGQWFKALTVVPGSFSFETGNWGGGWTVIAGRTIIP